MPNIDSPFMPGRWQDAAAASDGAYVVEWDGVGYDLANEDDASALIAERVLADDQTGAAMDAVVAAQIRQRDAEAEAERLQQQIAEHTATAAMYDAVNEATGMNAYVRREAERRDRGKQLERFRADYGEPWRRSSPTPATADLAVPAEPVLDERTAQIREHRRRAGM
jgi:hypothetical protein